MKSMWLWQRKKEEKLERERYWLENGGKLLEELIHSCNGKYNPIRMFSTKELNSATNNYDETQIVFEGVSAIYKGTHEDRLILVKRFRPEEHNSLWSREKIINEMVMLSQLNHNNILKLSGCCLENKIPVLIHEFASNGPLEHHIYEGRDSSPFGSRRLLSWENRIRIATEIADAIAYIHTGTSRPIIHRDISSKSILLDQNYVAKLFNFHICITIPAGKTHIKGVVVGIGSGYIAPEYSMTGRITEKIDVYSFGLLLIELLTGKRNTYNIWQTYRDIQFPVAPTILAEGGIQHHQLQAFAELSFRCIENEEEKRPTMIEVAKELRRIKKMSLQP